MRQLEKNKADDSSDRKSSAKILRSLKFRLLFQISMQEA